MESRVYNQTQLPTFEFKLDEIEPALKQIIQHNEESTTKLLASDTPPSWKTLIEPLEEMDNYLDNMWCPIMHLNDVNSTDEFNEVYAKCESLIQDYQTKSKQNQALYKAILFIKNSEEFSHLGKVQQKIIKDMLLDFELAGVNLSEEKRQLFAKYSSDLQEKTQKFMQNVSKSAEKGSIHIDEKESEQLLGLPATALKIAREKAVKRNMAGWVITLDIATYTTAMKNLKNRELRKQLYKAYFTSASDLGPKEFDNTGLIEDILKTRYQLAKLLNYNNFVDYSLAKKMIGSESDVMSLFNDLVKRFLPIAKKELHEIKKLALLDGVSEVQAWDIDYYTEKFRQTRYDLHQEMFRAYFPLNKVLAGMFAVYNKLFGIKITEQPTTDVWHPDVRTFAIHDKDNQLRGYVYIDLFARNKKMDNAWAFPCRKKHTFPNGDTQRAVAFLNCNFNPPTQDTPSLLTHTEIRTLFHEFGHCLHETLSQADYSSVSGMEGVPLDAVEFPSQIMENWCLEKEVMPLISGHYQTGEPLPDQLYNKLVKMGKFRNGIWSYLPAMDQLWTIELALIDFRLHQQYDPSKEAAQIQKIINEVRSQVSVFDKPDFNRYQDRFVHIFHHGYEGGYYSYIWSDVLASDAFGKFREKGIFDAETGQAYLKTILEPGGSCHPMDLFIAFRGRRPKLDALLKEYDSLDYSMPQEVKPTSIGLFSKTPEVEKQIAAENKIQFSI